MSGATKQGNNGTTPGQRNTRARPQPRTAPSALGLLDAAKSQLVAASSATSPGARYAAAHLAALRAAAAVLAARARPDVRRNKKPRSAWELLPGVAPELSEWAAFFAAGAGKRAAAEAGLPRAVTRRDADDLVRDAETFLVLVEEVLGLHTSGSLQPVRDGRANFLAS